MGVKRDTVVGDLVLIVSRRGEWTGRHGVVRYISKELDGVTRERMALVRLLAWLPRIMNNYALSELWEPDMDVLTPNEVRELAEIRLLGIENV